MPVVPPTGSVTLMFTDIEASTVLWETAPELMRVALELHDACLRALIERHQGYEMRTEGDAFKVAFGSPADAVRWAVEVQTQLMQLPWPDGLRALPHASDVLSADGTVAIRGLRVRIGGHTGFPEAQIHPTTGRTEYHGPMVNETARVAAAPHGGQVVVSAMTWEAARRATDLSALVCVDLGRHQLKGVREPEHLLQVSARELAGRTFPALRTESVRQTNVQAPGDAFVGREHERTRLKEAFDAGARLVSLLGPGGTGKTRLATEHARSCGLDYATAGGVWRCDLEEAVDLASICAGVARTLSIPMMASADPRDAADTIGRALRGLSPVLLVLDNLEQAVEAGHAALTAWLREAPDARFLITSREAMGIPGEQRIELGGLSEEAAHALFIDRVRQVRAGWEPSADDAAAIDEIARQLDYMPLALELAASRANVLAPRAIAKRLSERFRLLKAGRNEDARQGTLRATIDWSWNLLDEGERAALAQCSVFAGGFSIESAEAVLDLDDVDDAPWPMDVVASLRQKSLLFSREGEGELRLGQYQSIQAYARERLSERGEVEAITERHAAHFAEAAQRWCDEMATPRELEAMLRMQAEVDNLRAAHRASVGKDPARACSLALSVAKVMASGGHGEWLERMVDDAVSTARGLGDPALLASLLVQRARVFHLAARPDEAVAAAHEAVEISRQAPKLEHIEVDAWLCEVLLAYYGSGETDATRNALAQAGRAAAATQDRILERVVQVHASFSARDGDQAMRLGKELRELGAPVHSAWAFQAASACLMQLDRLDEALDCQRAAARVWGRLRQRHDLFNAHAQAAMIALRKGQDASDSIDLAEQAISPVQAPGKHAAIQIMRATQAVLEARGAPTEHAAASARARELMAQMRAPGPDGGRSLHDRSAWLNGAMGSLEAVLAMSG